MVGGHRLDSPCLGYRSVVGSCGHDNEPSDSIKCQGCLQLLNTSQDLKKVSAPQNLLQRRGRICSTFHFLWIKFGGCQGGQCTCTNKNETINEHNVWQCFSNYELRAMNLHWFLNMFSTVNYQLEEYYVYKNKLNTEKYFYNQN